MLPKNGGVIMVTFVPGFVIAKVNAWNKLQTAEQDRLKAAFPADAAAVKAGVDKWTAANPAPSATIADVADHVDHIRKVAGIDHIGVGGDFDGITQTVKELDNVSTYPRLTAELLKRGYSRRRREEDPRAEHPARHARGREGLEASPVGARPFGGRVE